MHRRQEVASFVRTTFRSVWSLELLSHLRTHRTRSWTRGELVEAMRASDLVVDQSVESLVAAGLIVTEEGETVRYAPVSDSLDAMVEAAERLYATSPNAVRRWIISGPNSGITAFADSFKLRRD